MSKLTGYTPSSRLIFLKPFGFFDYVHLQQQALCVLSDSGTISEGLPSSAFRPSPCVHAMERPEALEPARSS
jgi:UDP-N-acetylglucosamine 2-epimerase (non-hydrolysing)